MISRQWPPTKRLISTCSITSSLTDDHSPYLRDDLLAHFLETRYADTKIIGISRWVG